MFNKSLSSAEIEEFDDFLMSDATPEECMDIVTLDGFLTAIVVGPKVVPPSEWLPLVWDETGKEEMIWESNAQAEKYIGLVMRQMNGIAGQFQHGPEEFEALTFAREVAGETIRIFDDWCYGFMLGVVLRSQDWEPIFSTDESGMAMSMITLYGTEDGWRELKGNPELAAEHDQHAELLEPSIRVIHEFWLKRRTVPTAMPAKSIKIGRNEPCPCGSGKKYKKCCGNVVTIH